MSEYFGWSVEIDDFFDRKFVPGIGYSPQLTGKPADWSQVVRTLAFRTRKEAREALARYRKSSAWAFKGRDRIYKSARVVRLRFTVETV